MYTSAPLRNRLCRPLGRLLCNWKLTLIERWLLLQYHVINNKKRKILSDDGASILDLECVWSLLIASFLVEINAKYLQKPVIKIPKKEIVCQIMEHQFYLYLNAKYLPIVFLSPNLGIIDVWFSYMNHMMLCPCWSLFIYLFAFEAIIWHNWSSNMEIEPNISHSFKINPIKFQIWKLNYYFWLPLWEWLHLSQRHFKKSSCTYLKRDLRKSSHTYLKGPGQKAATSSILKGSQKMATPILKGISKCGCPAALSLLVCNVQSGYPLISVIFDYMGWWNLRWVFYLFMGYEFLTMGRWNLRCVFICLQDMNFWQSMVDL